MKRFTPMLLIAVMLLSSCTFKSKLLSADYFFFANTKWGMTKEETRKELNVKEFDFVETPVTSGRNVTMFRVDNYNYNGNECRLTLLFSVDIRKTVENSARNVIKDGSLIGIYVDFKDNTYIDEEYNNLIETIGNPKQSTWDSTKTVADYIRENDISINDYLAYSTTPPKKIDAMSEAEKFEIFEDVYLATAKIEKYHVPNDDGYTSSLELNGALYASVATFE